MSTGLTMSLASDRFRRIAELFEAARSVDAAQLEAWLRRHCDDPEVREEVRSLLSASSRTPGFLEAPPFGIVAGTELTRTRAVPPPVDAGDGIVGLSVAGYQIVRRIAAGGMGVVYEALQQQPNRTVAFKVIRPDLVSEETLQRFRVEADLLGRLQHPGIAAIYEAGTFTLDSDAAGVPRPFCAMEFVEGHSLLIAADRRAADVAERLELLAQIADAVDHAHRRGVLHRDLKSSNIIVTESGQPKVLDFGIARALDDERSVTLRTSVGRIVGTLGCMSPEQLRGENHRVDPRSDIYALGVLAYELLAGRPPFDLRGRGVAESIRHLCDAEPTSLRRLRRDLSGDIATVVAKAMEKDPTRRYDSAAALASDLRACLAHQPIQARPPNGVYLARKFVRRNRGVVSALGLAFVILLAAVVATSLGWSAALQTTQSKERVNQLLLGLLDRMDPERVGSSAVQIETALIETARLADEVLADEPEIGAVLRDRLGDSFAGLGRFDLAEVQFRESLVLNRALHGDESLEAAASMNKYGSAVRGAGRAGEATRLHQHALRIRRSKLPPGHVDLAESLNNLAAAQASSGQHSEAIRSLTESVEILRRLDPLRPDRLAGALSNLAAVHMNSGSFEEAMRLALESVAVREQHGILTVEDADSLSATGGALIHVGGGAPRSIPLLQRAYELRRALLPNDHPSVSESRLRLAYALTLTGEHAEAIALLTEIFQAIEGSPHWSRRLELECLTLAIRCRETLGPLEEAERLRRRKADLVEDVQLDAPG